MYVLDVKYSSDSPTPEGSDRHIGIVKMGPGVAPTKDNYVLLWNVEVVLDGSGQFFVKRANQIEVERGTEGEYILQLDESVSRVRKLNTFQACFLIQSWTKVCRNYALLKVVSS